MRYTVRYLMELLAGAVVGRERLVKIFIMAKYCPQKEKAVLIANSCLRQHYKQHLGYF